MSRILNFSAGPAALPEPVLRQAADEISMRGGGACLHACTTKHMDGFARRHG